MAAFSSPSVLCEAGDADHQVAATRVAEASVRLSSYDDEHRCFLICDAPACESTARQYADSLGGRLVDVRPLTLVEAEDITGLDLAGAEQVAA